MLDGDHQELLEATEFQIFADNAFVLFINGQYVGVSGNVTASVPDLEAAYLAADSDADLFFDGIESLNIVDYDCGQEYNFEITIASFNVSQALKEAVASGRVHIEIFAYNEPLRDELTGEIRVPGRANYKEDEPPCLVFVCNLAYKYFNDI